MVLKKRGHFKVHGSSGIITVPADLIKDDRFPLKDNYKVMIEVTEGKLIVSPLPRFEHINTYLDHAAIYDNELGRGIDVYFHENGIAWCDYCKSPNCEHIEYALTLPAVEEPLKTRGWKRRQEQE